MPAEGRRRFRAETTVQVNGLNLGRVLAHRGLLAGADGALENRHETVARALGLGFGVETDVRFCPASGAHYISHDPGGWTADNDALRHFALWRRFPEQVIALNLKDLEALDRLVRSLVQHELLSQVFLFDMELLEEVPGLAAARLRALDPRIRVAARASDREPVQRAAACPHSDRVWLDEFAEPWAGPATFEALARAGKEVYAVAPDLHGAALATSRKRWLDFASWGATGLCTDYPLQLARDLGLAPGAPEEGEISL